jgi:hypothetical protein
MKDLVELVAVLAILVAWICGLVLAKGFWSTLFAVCVPPWAWYLVAERGLQLAGWIA